MIRQQAMQDHTRTTGHEVIAVEGVATCSECPWQYPPAPTGDPQLIQIHGGPGNGATLECPKTATALRFRVVPYGGERMVDIDLPIEQSALADVFMVRWPADDATEYMLVGVPIPLLADGTEVDAQGLPVAEPTLLPREPETVDLLGALQESVDRARAARPKPEVDVPTDPELPVSAVFAAVKLATERVEAENTDPGPEPEEPTPEPPLSLRDRIANLIDVYFGMQDGNPGLPNAAAAADLTDAIHKVVSAGADYETARIEGADLTTNQALAYLLDLPEWARITRLGMLLEANRKYGQCYLEDHAGLAEQLKDVTQHRDRLHHAMVQIARITATVDQPESVGQSVIGSISSEALVPE